MNLNPSADAYAAARTSVSSSAKWDDNSLCLKDCYENHEVTYVESPNTGL